MVAIKVGSVLLKATLDTGASRNLLRSTVGSQLRRHEGALSAMGRRTKVSNPRTCEGIMAGSETKAIMSLQEVGLTFMALKGSNGKDVTTTVEFSEMDDISEPIIIGHPTLKEWGFAISEDLQGNMIVEFRTLGIEMMGLTKREQGI